MDTWASSEVTSTPSPSPSCHSNAATSLRPAPNGIILISLEPVMSSPSPSPQGRKRSGMNSLGRSHVPSSMPMSYTMTFSDEPLGTT
nr:unnamed protein product [Digitaria exilis]